MDALPGFSDNATLTARARAVMPAGLLSPSRRIEQSIAFTRAEGPYLHDADGNRYIDAHCGFGAILLGHCAEPVRQRVAEVSARIDLIGSATTDLEVEAAETLVRLIPCAELVSFCSSGSEATYHAIRLARAATGRRTIIKFQGGYHGWHDFVAMNAQSPADRIGRYDPLSAGMLTDAARHTVVLPYNDTAAVAGWLDANPEQAAAIIVEPIAHNMGSVIAHDAFLAELRRLADRHGTVLIFDEVITGFRHGLGGYQAICGITPDLATFGKAVASGHPIGILAGRRDLRGRPLMELLGRSGDGGVFMGGTFNGTSSALAALLATIGELERPGFYERLYGLGERMRSGLGEIAGRLGLPVQAAGYGSVWLLYFFEGAFERYEDLLRNDDRRDAEFRRRLVGKRVIFQPVPLKRLYLAAAHTPEVVDRTLELVEESLKEVYSMARS